VQQALASPNELENFVTNASSLRLLRSVFAGLYSLDCDEYEQPVVLEEGLISALSPEKGSPSSAVKPMKKLKSSGKVMSFEDVKNQAISRPELYVMKPQREGGGNNIYGSAVADSLKTMSSNELKAYILMERIFPTTQKASLLREGLLVENVS